MPGLWIPETTHLGNSELSFMEASVYSIIASYTLDGKECYMRDDDFMEYFGIGHSKFHDIRNKLLKLGYINQHKGGKHNRRYLTATDSSIEMFGLLDDKATCPQGGEVNQASYPQSGEPLVRPADNSYIDIVNCYNKEEDLSLLQSSNARASEDATNTIEREDALRKPENNNDGRGNKPLPENLRQYVMDSVTDKAYAGVLVRHFTFMNGYQGHYVNRDDIDTDMLILEACADTERERCRIVMDANARGHAMLGKPKEKDKTKAHDFGEWAF